MISQSRTPAGILRTLTAILCLAAILMSVTGSSAWAAPRVVRVVGIQDGISDSQADYFRRTIAELNDLTEDRIFVTRPIPAASSLDLNAYQGLDFAIVSPRVFALLERYNGFIPMASLSVDIPDCEPGAELRPVVSALVFATPDADEDGLAKPHLSDIASDIVEHVRDYARKRRRQITPVDLTQMSAKVVSSMRASNARVSFESEVPAGLFVEGDSLEIELVLRNLVKNAGESAAQADGVPRVVLAGERIGDEVVITVTDNGPVRTKAEIDAFLVPLRSEKSGGLGLGLAIVRRIIEAYGGTIVFDVVEPQGVRVEARLPARPDL